MLKKAEEEGAGDIYLALLEYRNTPVSGTSFSPAQMLMGRSLRTKIPTTKQRLKPETVDPRVQLMQQKVKQKAYYDRSSRPLASLQPGDTIRVQRRNNAWEPASVVKIDAHPRSYWVEHGSGNLRRNRRHIMKTSEPPPFFSDVAEDLSVPYQLESVPAVTNDAEGTVNSHTPCAVVTGATEVIGKQRTSSGRVVKSPRKFQDFVRC